MATMVDIAKRAGVALSTVSHTLSGKRPVSPEVREKVLQAMSDLNYQPNALGRALRNKSTRTIALLYPTAFSDIPESHFEFVSGIVEETSERKYGLLLWTNTDEDQEVFTMAQQGFIDGLILMEIRLEDSRVKMLRDRNYPFTLIGHCRENEGINFVDLDFDYAIHTSVEHLAQLGHKHIAFVNHSVAQLEAGVGYIVRSEEAYHHAVEQWGLDGHSFSCEPGLDASYTTVKMVLTQHPEITAIVTGNILVSSAITRATYDSGLRIPEDVSIVALVTSRFAEMTAPTLTTIDFPSRKMGHMGAEMLIRQLEGEQVSSQVLLRPPLTIRQSSGLCMR